jgi:ribosome-associated protein
MVLAESVDLHRVRSLPAVQLARARYRLQVAEDGIVTPGGIVVPPSALSWRFSRAGGPGGQHVNTADSRVELLCDLDALVAPEAVLARVAEKLGSKVSVVAAAERSQWRNRQLALERLATRLDRAAHRTPPRRPTRPTRGAVERRLSDKRVRSERKAARKTTTDTD